MSLRRVVLSAGAAALFLASRPAAPENPRVKGIVLRPDQGPYEGPCPAPLTFTGRLKLSGPGAVRYQFVRSDGVRSPAQTEKFEGAGTQPVRYEWSLDGPARMTVKGWVKLKSLAPNVLESRPAAVSVTCTQ